MMAENFQWNIVGNAACIKILMMTEKGCVQLTSNDAYLSNTWFSVVRMDE